MPSLQRFHDLLGQQIRGKLHSVHCEAGQYLPAWRPDSDYRHSVSAQHELGGGTLPELSHELDYLRWIFGEIDWVKASLSRQSNLKTDVEDCAHLLVGFAPAVDGHRLIASVNLDFIRHDTTRLCAAIGDKGSLRWNGMTGEVALYAAGAKKWRVLYRHPNKRDDSYLAEWEHFWACVTEHDTLAITGEDGVRVIQIIESVRNEAVSGGQTSVVI